MAVQDIELEERGLQSKTHRKTNDRRKPKKSKHVYFIVGFIMSTVLALTAYILMHGIVKIFEVFTDYPIVSDKCEGRLIGFHDLESQREVTKSQLSKFTHLVLYPLVIQANGTFDFRTSNEKQNFKTVIRKAKFTSVKTMFSIWDMNYSYKIINDIVEDVEKRRIFINAIASFIKDNQLDGVDIYWRWAQTEEEAVHFLDFCKELREKLAEFNGAFILSVTFDPHYLHYSTNFADVFKYVNFMNVNTKNFYGAWISRSPQLIGPSSPLYSGHGKYQYENLDQTMKYYACETNRPYRFNVMVEFTGRTWNNVIIPNDTSSTLWMTAEMKDGKVEGDSFTYRGLPSYGWNITSASWNDESKTPYIWKPDQRTYLTFENDRSLEEKTRYLIGKNIGGLAVWKFVNDDEKSTLMSVLAAANLCSGKNNTIVKYNCDHV